MKIFHKRRESVGIGERESDIGNNQVFYGVEGNSFQRDEFHPHFSTEYANEGNPISRSRSLGGLVRKLNCAGSKKHDYDLYHDLNGGKREIDDYYEVNSMVSPNNSQNEQALPNLGKQQSKPEITRPVLITVKNGDMNGQIPYSENKHAHYYHEKEARASFIVGELPPPTKMCTSSSFKLGMTARKRYQNASKYFKHQDNVRNSSYVSVGSGWSNDDEQIERRRAAQEAARRERWKRGLEMENRMTKGAKAWSSSGRYRNGDDSCSTDSLTQGSHTTETSMTNYESSDDSSTVDDWTDASDESRKQTQFYRNYPGQCTTGTQIVANVAEDFGIFAKLILSDGAACLGTAAAITTETVGSCKGGEKSPERPPERRSERRRWGRKRA